MLQRVPREKRAAQLVVDVGANIGFFSLTAASYGVRTISFEPMRFNLDRFVSSIERNRGFGGRMEVYNMAVSNSNQMVFLKPTSAKVSRQRSPTTFVDSNTAKQRLLVAFSFH